MWTIWDIRCLRIYMTKWNGLKVIVQFLFRIVCFLNKGTSVPNSKLTLFPKTSTTSFSEFRFHSYSKWYVMIVFSWGCSAIHFGVERANQSSSSRRKIRLCMLLLIRFWEELVTLVTSLRSLFVLCCDL